MSKHAIIIGAIVLTLAYFGAVALVHYGGADSSLATYVEKHDLNSLGDFLAGVFSPLAFLWLTATVLIQSNELALQRKELTDNRRVMEEQAKAAKAQVAVADTQTALSYAAAEANWKLSLFDKRMKIYMELQEVCERMGDVGNIDDRLMQRLLKLSNEIKFVFDEDVQGWIGGVIAEVEDALDARREWSRLFIMQQQPDRTEEDDNEMHVAEMVYRDKSRSVEALFEWDMVKQQLDKHVMLPHRIDPIRYMRTH